MFGVDEVVGADEFPVVELGLAELAVDEPAFAFDPFVTGGAGTHVIPFAGVACVPCGAGLTVVGAVCGFVPGVGACGVFCASGPAAFVVIGVGGPIVVGVGVVLGGAGAAVGAAAAGVEVCGAGVAVGGGAVGRPWAAPHVAQANTRSKVVNRIVIRNPSFRKHRCILLAESPIGVFPSVKLAKNGGYPVNALDTPVHRVRRCGLEFL